MLVERIWTVGEAACYIMTRASARVLSNNPKEATRINGKSWQLIRFLSLSLMFLWFDMEDEVLRVDLGASY
jgi:hypothetical protein